MTTEPDYYADLTPDEKKAVDWKVTKIMALGAGPVLGMDPGAFPMLPSAYDQQMHDLQQSLSHPKNIEDTVAEYEHSQKPFGERFKKGMQTVFGKDNHR